MSELIFSANQDNIIKLSECEKQVLSLLKREETEDIPVSKWYLGALYVINNHANPDRYSQAAQSLREIFEKLPRINNQLIKQANFKQYRKDIEELLSKAKSSSTLLESEEINADLVNLIKKLEEYIDRNKTLPSRSEQIYTYTTAVDPMSNFLSSNIDNKKRKHLQDVWSKFESIAHHQTPQKNVEEDFTKAFDAFNQIILDVLSPITAENQFEIQEILNKQEVSPEDKKKMVTLLSRKGANLNFLLENATQSFWFDFLIDKNFIIQPLDEDCTRKIVQFLHKIIEQEPKKVTDYVGTIKHISNPNTLFHIALLVTKIEDLSIAFTYKKHINNFIKCNNSFAVHEILSPLVEKWSVDEHGISKLLDILKFPLSFQADPEHKKKEEFFKKNKDDLRSILNPKPYLERWEYEQVVEKVVKPLAQKSPFNVAISLLKISNIMLNLKHFVSKDTDTYEDYSAIWCKNLSISKNRYENTEEFLLITALTFACEQVYTHQPEKIIELDQEIRKLSWRVFTRLRLHLYAKFLTEQTLPWISAYLLDYPYSNKSYDYELQQCIKNACEQFKEMLFTEAQLKSIISKILQGPPQKRLCDSAGNQLPQEICEQIKDSFHYKQLHPFYSVLPDETKTYYTSLHNKLNFELHDEDYLPPSYSKGGVVFPHSPKTFKEFKTMSDEEILSFINEWDNPKSWIENKDESEEDVFFETTHFALADEFKKYFIEIILQSDDKLNWWRSNYTKITRPIYISYLLKSFQESYKNNNSVRVNEGLELCNYILQHQDTKESSPDTTSSVSNVNPNWREARDNVIDYINELIKSKNTLILDYKEKLIALLEQVYTDFNYMLDTGKSFFYDEEKEDFYLEALNNTRSKCIETIIHFGVWLNENGESASVAELISILEKRINNLSQYPLTLPEYAVFAVKYSTLYKLNQEWTKQIQDIIFPSGDTRIWFASFSSLVRYCSPHKFYYDTLSEHFIYAINKVPNFLKNDQRVYIETTKKLGEYYFVFYLSSCYSLTGESSLLEKYYTYTLEHKNFWADLLDYTGFNFKESREQLEAQLVERGQEFLEWRVQEENVTELQKFSYWLRASCFNAQWRLTQFSKILDLTDCIAKHPHAMIDSLSTLYDEEKYLSLECLEKIIKKISLQSYFDERKIKPILANAINSSDINLSAKAENIINLLLQSGKSSYLDIIKSKQNR